MRQPPIRNASVVGVSVFSHSGEFAFSQTDLALPGRGIDLLVVRSYRSALAGQAGPFGRGWSCGILKQIDSDGHDVVYRDGMGASHRFKAHGGGAYTAPPGLYAILRRERPGFVLHFRHGLIYRFADPAHGGGIQAVEDRNHNKITISGGADERILIDTLRRQIVLAIHESCVRELSDHAGRVWTYRYDERRRLIGVGQPATPDFPPGTSLAFSYDAHDRLLTMTDGKGQTRLANTYDADGRVIAQQQGSGACRIQYETVGSAPDGSPIYRTTCRRKNASTLIVEHDALGTARASTLRVRRDAFAPEDIVDVAGTNVPLSETSTYNANAELVERTFPAGNRRTWVFAEDDLNVLSRGNLLRVTEHPSPGAAADQASLTETFEYEPAFQRLAARTDRRECRTTYEYDKRGNLIVVNHPPVSLQPVSDEPPRPALVSTAQRTQYAYNAGGQLIRRTHIDGSVTEFHYHPADDPGGRLGLRAASGAPDRVGGYLARTVRDPNGAGLTTAYIYDRYGTLSAVFDAHDNPTRLRFNAMGKLEVIVGREPFKYRIDYTYDANYNAIESSRSFERVAFDESARQLARTSSTLRELREYNSLDNLVARRFVGDEKTICERVVRDAAERIVRWIQPLGEVTEFGYDERDRVIERTAGVGSREMRTERFAYSLNAAPRARIDGEGNRTLHVYDGFHRYQGYIDAMGARKHQTRDAAGNVVRVTVSGSSAAKGKTSEPDSGDATNVPLMDATYHYDEWNRLFRMDRAWHDAAGVPLGASGWNGEEGIVSTLIEYAENGQAGKVWSESADVLALGYDAAGRLTSVTNSSGDVRIIDYDDAGNAAVFRFLGPTEDGRRTESVIRRGFDAMGRLTSTQINDDAPERFAYDAFGQVVEYVGKTGIEVRHLVDALGRRVGHAFDVSDPTNEARTLQIVRRVEYDDNYRVSASVDAAGNRTTYSYDSIGRQTRIAYANGAVASVEHDARGNIVRAVDANRRVTSCRYDAAGRVTERRTESASAGAGDEISYAYDAAGRLTNATANGVELQRTYDALSLVLEERQGARVLRYAHDAAGNLIAVGYPGGRELLRTFDGRGRVVSVQEKGAGPIATFSYRAGGQVQSMSLGGVLEASLSYDSGQRLESIEYRRREDRSLVESFLYAYDAAGRMAHETRSRSGVSAGERYYYDEARRPVRAQYGVVDVLDPQSEFERETSYEYFAEGPWSRRIDRDGRGRIVSEQRGVVDARNRYVTFGKYSFQHDATGNCLRKESSNPGFCLYTYDQDNRLVKSECYEKDALRQTIEYSYDALGRLVRKLVTDANGVTTEYTYVWAGSLLIEEYENGVLARSYVYGLGANPVQFSKHDEGQSDFVYVLNGKGQASGLVLSNNPNAFAERYGYEITGAFSMTEIGGVPVALPDRNTATSNLKNSILSSTPFGSVMADWESGTLGFGGTKLDATIGEALNMFNSMGGHGDARSAFQDQLGGILSLLGLLGNTAGPRITGTDMNLSFPNMSLYADGQADAGTGGAKNGGGAGPRDSRVTAMIGLINGLSNWASTPQTIGPFETTNGKLFGGLVNGGVAPLTPRTQDPNPYGVPNDAETNAYNQQKNAKDEPGKNANDALDRSLADAKAEAADKEWQQARAEEKAETSTPEAKEAVETAKQDASVDPDDGGVGAYYDPDAETYVVIPTPDELNAKLNSRKQPVNPNGRPESPPIDASSPPPHWGGLDPTVAYFDGDASVTTFSGTPRIDIAPIDHVPGWEGLAPQGNPQPANGGDSSGTIGWAGRNP